MRIGQTFSIHKKRAATNGSLFVWLNSYQLFATEQDYRDYRYIIEDKERQTKLRIRLQHRHILKSRFKQKINQFIAGSVCLIG